MTQTVRHFVELDDLLGFNLTCSKCDSAVSIPLKSFDRAIPPKCPNCGSRWVAKMNDRPVGDYVQSFAEAIESLRREMKEDVGFNLLLETSAPVSSGKD